MASVLCERRLCASPTFFSISRTQNFLAPRAAQPWAPTAWARASLPRRSPTACGRRDLSTTASLHARLVQRPQRPYQFTQMIQLSDGSTFTVRTTNPHPLHRCNKDSRNHIIWQPSDKSLRNVEVDEAGRLAAFRSRFGRGWDAATDETAKEAGDSQSNAAGQADNTATDGAASYDMLADLLSGYAAKEESANRGGLSAKEQAKMDKKKK